MLKKARLLTRPTPARQDAPFRGQGHSSPADLRFTFHASRFTAAGSDARTKLADFFSILLRSAQEIHRSGRLRAAAGGLKADGKGLRICEARHLLDQ